MSSSRVAGCLGLTGISFLISKTATIVRLFLLLAMCEKTFLWSAPHGLRSTPTQLRIAPSAPLWHTFPYPNPLGNRFRYRLDQHPLSRRYRQQRDSTQHRPEPPPRIEQEREYIYGRYHVHPPGRTPRQHGFARTALRWQILPFFNGLREKRARGAPEPTASPAV